MLVNSLVMLKRDSIACSKIEIIFIAVPSFLVDVWEVPRSEIVLGKELGSGQFGVSVKLIIFFNYCIAKWMMDR